MLRTWAVVLAMAVLTGAGARDAVAGEPRPHPRVLRLDEADVLARFTDEVERDANLRTRALVLWRAHFATKVAAIERRFERDDDWRPALADAAVLVDDFLEASLLPRRGEWSAGGGKVWVETLDPATGQRARTLRPARPDRAIFAPGGEEKDKAADGLKQGSDPRQGAQPGDRRPAPRPAR
jgi:hypothetical protein